MRRKKLIKSEVINIFKTTKETLRYYEKAGLICPEVSENNYKLYYSKDLKTLRQIKFLKDIGLSIGEIKEVLLNENRDKSSYGDILKDKNLAIKKEIERLKVIEKKIASLQNLLKDNGDLYHHKIEVKKLPERSLLIYDNKGNEESDIKWFYDNIKNNTDKFSFDNCNFLMIRELEDLEKYDYYDLTVGVELRNSNNANENDVLVIPKGEYLILTFLYDEKGRGLLRKAYKLIKEYTDKNNIKLNDKYVLEKEIEELGNFYEDQCVYEFQVLIDSK